MAFRNSWRWQAAMWSAGATSGARPGRFTPMSASWGQRLGLKLIRQTLAAAEAFGFHRVELTVRAENANAIALYRRVGFELEGCLRGDVCVDGVYSDLLVMAVLL